jgi:hypothetical protein
MRLSNAMRNADPKVLKPKTVSGHPGGIHVSSTAAVTASISVAGISDEGNASR